MPLMLHNNNKNNDDITKNVDCVKCADMMHIYKRLHVCTLQTIYTQEFHT